MFGKIAYYLIIIPFSYLPLWVLYRMSDLLYLLFLSILPYRRKVVRENLDRSFPTKSGKEKKLIERKFYRYLSNVMMESVKGLSISQRNLLKRIKVLNPELMEKLYESNKNVLLIGGHYNNWEWMILAQDLIFKHKAIGVGKPLSNKFFNKKFNNRRERFGLRVTNNKELKECFDEYLVNGKVPASVLLLADQSPGDSLKSYWMNFLNNLTPVLYGPEYLAVAYNATVVYYDMQRASRGKYTLELKVLSSKPRKTEWGEITEAHASAMEASILRNPEYWVWSHKRWKRSIPEDLDSLKEKQKEKFANLKKRYV